MERRSRGPRASASGADAAGDRRRARGRLSPALGGGSRLMTHSSASPAAGSRSSRSPPLRCSPAAARSRWRRSIRALARRLDNVRLDPGAAESAINAYRASRGLKPLRLDPALTAMAQRQADAMVAGDALSHNVGGPFTDAPRRGRNRRDRGGRESRRRLFLARRGDGRLARLGRARRQPAHGAASPAWASPSPRARARITASIGRWSSPPISSGRRTRCAPGGF